MIEAKEKYGVTMEATFTGISLKLVQSGVLLENFLVNNTKTLNGYVPLQLFMSSYLLMHQLPLEAN